MSVDNLSILNTLFPAMAVTQIGWPGLPIIAVTATASVFDYQVDNPQQMQGHPKCLGAIFSRRGF